MRKLTLQYFDKLSYSVLYKSLIYYLLIPNQMNKNIKKYQSHEKVLYFIFQIAQYK